MEHPGGGQIVDFRRRSPAPSDSSSRRNSQRHSSADTTASLGTSSGGTLTTRYRRNGKLQSCEPCRKSKLRCDHTTPSCGRCIRRRCADKCVYHPNPMTQNRPISPIDTPTSASQSPPPSHQRQQQQRRLSSASGPAQPPHTATAISSPSVPLPSPASLLAGSNPVSRPRHTPRPSIQSTSSYAGQPPSSTISSPVNQDYMGATSFSSIFSESLAKFGLSTELRGLRQFATNPQTARNLPSPSDDAVIIEQGARVLALLQNRTLINDLIDRLLEITDGTADIFDGSIIYAWLDGLWSVHGAALASQDPAEIRALCVLLWQNTSTPMSYNSSTTPTEWIAAATGHNIRWEVVGIILGLVGDCATCLVSTDRVFTNRELDRSGLVLKLSRGTKLCLTFCQDVSAAMDDLILYLARQVYNITVGSSIPNSFAPYQASGTVISAVIAMGLHQEDDPSYLSSSNSGQGVPFFLTELRKRAAITSYAQEVGLATFLGRPPRLSYKYCNFKLPCGLSPAQILLPEQERESLLAQLGPNGFRLDGCMTEPAFRQIWWSLAPRREDIIDLSIGSYTPDEVLRRAAEIEKQLDESWARLPLSIRDASHGPTTTYYDRISPFERLLHDLCRQMFCSNRLLLRRVVIQKVPGMSSDELIKGAYEFLDDMIRASQRPEMTTTYRVDAISGLVFHGLRCAAIIAVELLRREHVGGSGSSNNSTTTPAKPLAFSRSQGIRMLSVFVSQLSSVESSEMWYHSCEQGCSLIGKIIDKILDSPGAGGGGAAANPAQQAAAAQQTQAQAQGQTLSQGGQPQSQLQTPQTSTAMVSPSLQPSSDASSDPNGTTVTMIPSGKEYSHMPHLMCESAMPRQQQNDPTMSQQQNQNQYSNNFPMTDVGGVGVGVGVDTSGDWAFDFSLDVPLLGNDRDLMQWFEGAY